MVFRKRRNPSSAFKLRPPYQAITGKHATLNVPGIYPYCAMMQIAATDDKADYVICRGHDPRIDKYVDYEGGNDNNPGIPVAKPYGNRSTDVYSVGEIFPALLPLSQLGQSPGVAATTAGHPADLDEDVEILYTDEGDVINWILLDEGGGEAQKKLFCRFTLDTGHALTTSESSEQASIESQWGYGTDHDDTSSITVNNLLTQTAGTYVFEGAEGAAGIAVYDPDLDTWHIIQMECP